MPLLSPRSYLFVPGSRPDRFAKACAAGADAVVIDLEDSVAAAGKATARAAIATWLAPAQSVYVRVNVANSEFFRDDLKLGGKPGIAGVLLPKAERIEDIHIVAEHFGAAVPLLLQIETAQGFRNAPAMAGAKCYHRYKFARARAGGYIASQASGFRRKDVHPSQAGAGGERMLCSHR